jgi:hypothetical protein
MGGPRRRTLLAVRGLSIRTTSGCARPHFCFATKPAVCRDAVEALLDIELDDG